MATSEGSWNPSPEKRLQRVKDGAKYGNIQLSEVESILSNENFTSNGGLLATTQEGQSTLLHLAAQAEGGTVLPLVCQAYKRAQLFPVAMASLNSGGLNPLHVAIQMSRFENTVLLFNECELHCTQALQPDKEDWTLLHSACLVASNVNIVKYLLSQERCREFVLCKGLSSRRRAPSLPLDIARDTVSQAELHLKMGEDQLDRFSKQGAMNSHARSMHARTMVDPKKKVLEKARELYSQIEQTTLELKASEAEKRVKDLEKTKAQERQEALNKELENLLTSNQWSKIEGGYLLSESEETRKMSVQFLVNQLVSESLTLPALSSNVLTSLSRCLSLPEDDLALLSLLKLFEGYSRSSAQTMLAHKEFLSCLFPLLSSRNTELQLVTISLLHNLVDNESFPTGDAHLLECLHLLRHYSSSASVQGKAGELVERLGAGGSPPNPGTWSNKQVALWLDSISELDRRDQYIEAFLRADISGLHLLELSVGEMGGLGVNFVSHQRTITDKIDELRRMNARSMVGHKDVFLSYAHININFARRIKRVLNTACYSVWIDEAGIRAGQKWRNEITDGIQSCGVFLLLLSKRSANSLYCHNEVAMAETYGKPIVTVRVEEVGEVDPGLTFIIGRRQWLDFSLEETFSSRSKALVETMVGYIGAGKHTQSDEVEEAPVLKHLPDKPPKHIGNVEVGGSGLLMEELEKLRVVMETGLEGLSQRMDQCERGMSSLTNRVTALEKL